MLLRFAGLFTGCLGLIAAGGQQNSDPPFPAATDSSFYELARNLVTDSLWRGQKPVRVRYAATSSLTLSALRRLNVAADSVAGNAAIMCVTTPERRATTADLQTFVLAWNMLWGRDRSTYIIYLSAGCRTASPRATNSMQVTGHSCGWELARRNDVWTVVRSLGCTVT